MAVMFNALVLPDEQESVILPKPYQFKLKQYDTSSGQTHLPL